VAAITPPMPKRPETEMIIHWIDRVRKAIVAILILVFAIPIFLYALFFVFFYIDASLNDKTDWRIEDYMCTLPEGCKEFTESRKRSREQQQGIAVQPNH
jgi:hypothetical protein